MAQPSSAVWRGGLGREQSRRKGGEAPFTKCKSRGGKPPTVLRIAPKACGVAWGTGERVDARRHAGLHTRLHRHSDDGAREAASGRAGLRAPELPPRSRERRQSAFPWRARVLARPPPPRSSADGRPSRPSTPAPVRADRVRHAAGAARRTGRSSPTARAAHAREPADAAADAHAAGGPAAAAAVVHQSSVARGVPTQPIHLSCLASLPNSCRRQTASQ